MAGINRYALVSLFMSLLLCGGAGASSVLDLTPGASKGGAAGKPSQAKPIPTRESLVGGMTQRMTLTSEDVRVMEPVCVLILGYMVDGGGFWYQRLANNPIMNKPEYVIARGAQSFHHYCWAEIARNRFYRAKDKASRDALVQSAIGDMLFVTSKRAYLPANWPYLGRMYVSLGDAYLLDEDTSNAAKSYVRALDEDRAYAPAYHALGDLWIKLGNKAKALETVTTALKYVPDDKGVRRRYTEWGGKAPLPALSAKPAKTPEREAETAKAAPPAAKKPAPVIEQVNRPSRNLPPEQAEEKRKANPWCRFCPW
jgi:hypothetical protein